MQLFVQEKLLLYSSPPSVVRHHLRRTSIIQGITNKNLVTVAVPCNPVLASEEEASSHRMAGFLDS